MAEQRIKCLIIDDDPFIQDLLKDKLELHLPEVEVLDIANNGAEGVEKIRRHKPEVLFLDVEMGDMTGFEMLNQLDDISFETIFITSFSHYAIKAIRFNALDYLVKPIDLEELKQAVERFKEKQAQSTTGDDVKQALLNFSTKDVSDQILTLNTQEGELRLKLKHILHIEGERNYSYIYLSNGKKKLVSKTLGDFEEILSDKAFFRSHKSHLVNYSHISTHKNYKVITLSDETEISVSRRKQDDFKTWYNFMTDR